MKFGVTGNSRVIIESQQSSLFLEIVIGCQLLGAVAIPVEKGCPAQKIVSYQSYFATDLAITSQEIDSPGSIKPNELKRMSMDCESIQGICQHGKNSLSELLLTSGSTGKEKAIAISYDADVALAENVINATGVGNGTVEFILTPLNHSHGLRRSFAELYAGGGIVLQQNLIEVKSLFNKFEKFKVNCADMSPATLSVLLSLVGDDLSRLNGQLDFIQFGGASLKETDKTELKRLLPSTKFFNMYGSTESGISCVYEFSAKEDKPGCIGRPCVNSRIKFVNEKGMEIDTSPDHPGYLSCASRANMLGIYDPNDNSPNYSSNVDLVISSDLAYLDEDGEIILVGRNDDVISIGGKKLNPAEIEAAATGFKDVQECACLGIKDNEGSETILVMLVKLRDGMDSTEFDEIRLAEFLRQNLEPYKVPKRYKCVPCLPRTFKGNLKRKELVKLLDLVKDN